MIVPFVLGEQVPAPAPMREALAEGGVEMLNILGRRTGEGINDIAIVRDYLQQPLDGNPAADQSFQAPGVHRHVERVHTPSSNHAASIYNDDVIAHTHPSRLHGRTTIMPGECSRCPRV